MKMCQYRNFVSSTIIESISESMPLFGQYVNAPSSGLVVSVIIRSISKPVSLHGMLLFSTFVRSIRYVVV